MVVGGGRCYGYADEKMMVVMVMCMYFAHANSVSEMEGGGREMMKVMTSVCGN